MSENISPVHAVKKRFVICLDGTWNNAARAIERTQDQNPKSLTDRISDIFRRGSPDRDIEDGRKVYRPTNVLKLARAACIKTEDALQVTHYDIGVGSMNRAPTGAAAVIKFTDNMLGGILGAGFVDNIEVAYTFLANNYSPGDEVFVFGFSRGAAQARSLCSFIAWAGGVPHKDDAYYTPRLFTRYLQQYGGGQRGPDIWQEMNEQRQSQGRATLKPLIPVTVNYLGLWDTVLSLGRRMRRKAPLKFQFHNTPTVPECVTCVRHALAIDEHRHDFHPEIFDDPAHPDLEQRWFAGVHSNVGGGLRDDSLANRPLKWIITEAETKGLRLDWDYLSFYRDDPLGWAGKKAMSFVISDRLAQPLRGFNGIRHMPPYPATTLDESVLERLKAAKLTSPENPSPYRPDNLETYLQGSPHYNA